MDRILEIGSIYKHFKGSEYRVIMTVINATAEGEVLVIYESLDSKMVWAREINEFLEELPEQRAEFFGQKYRFMTIEELTMPGIIF